MRLDLTVLESIPSSELYVGEMERVAAVAIAPGLVRALGIIVSSARFLTPPQIQFRTKAKPSPRPQSGSSRTTTTLGGSLPAERLSALLQIADDELYFDFEVLGKLGVTPPWPFNSSAFAAHTLCHFEPCGEQADLLKFPRPSFLRQTS